MSSEKSIFDKVEDYLTPDAEEAQSFSQTESAVAGIISGAIKIPEGVSYLNSAVSESQDSWSTPSLS